MVSLSAAFSRQPKVIISDDCVMASYLGHPRRQHKASAALLLLIGERRTPIGKSDVAQAAHDRIKIAPRDTRADVNITRQFR